MLRRPERIHSTDEPQPIEVIYEDQDVIAVNKPGGLFVHPTNLDRSEQDSVVKRLRDTLNMQVSPVHRLDRPTSGTLLLAKHAESLKFMNEQFATHKVRKTYLALVRGWINEHGLIDYPLKHQTKDQLQQSCTEWWRIAIGEFPVPTPPHSTSRFSLVQVNPQTGRWHQIRRHFAHLRHPVVGDTTHGDGHQNRILRQILPPARLFLHALELRCRIPRMSDRELIIQSPLPGWFQHFKAQFTSHSKD